MAFRYQSLHTKINITCIFRKYFLPDICWRIFLVSLTIIEPTGECQNIWGGSTIFMGNTPKPGPKSCWHRPGYINDPVSTSIRDCSGILKKFSLRILNSRIIIDTGPFPEIGLGIVRNRSPGPHPITLIRHRSLFRSQRPYLPITGFFTHFATSLCLKFEHLDVLK